MPAPLWIATLVRKEASTLETSIGPKLRSTRDPGALVCLRAQLFDHEWKWLFCTGLRTPPLDKYLMHVLRGDTIHGFSPELELKAMRPVDDRV